MKKVIGNERGDVVQFLLVFLTWIGIIGFLTIKLILSGHLFWGIISVIFLVVPSILIILTKVFGIDIEKNLNEKINEKKQELEEIERSNIEK